MSKSRSSSAQSFFNKKKDEVMSKKKKKGFKMKKFGKSDTDNKEDDEE